MYYIIGLSTSGRRTPRDMPAVAQEYARTIIIKKYLAKNILIGRSNKIYSGRTYKNVYKKICLYKNVL